MWVGACVCACVCVCVCEGVSVIPFLKLKPLTPPSLHYSPHPLPPSPASPDFIVVDEIGNKEEAQVCCEIVSRGVPVIASVHSPDISGLISNAYVNGEMNPSVDPFSYMNMLLMRCIFIFRKHTPGGQSGGGYVDRGRGRGDAGGT